jgi:hypothetical protein
MAAIRNVRFTLILLKNSKFRFDNIQKTAGGLDAKFLRGSVD